VQNWSRPERIHWPVHFSEIEDFKIKTNWLGNLTIPESWEFQKYAIFHCVWMKRWFVHMEVSFNSVWVTLQVAIRRLSNSCKDCSVPWFYSSFVQSVVLIQIIVKLILLLLCYVSPFLHCTALSKKSGNKLLFSDFLDTPESVASATLFSNWSVHGSWTVTAVFLR